MKEAEMVRDRRASEYGGEPGRIAKPPHPFGPTDANPAEYLRKLRDTEAGDITDTPEAALLREWSEEGR